MPRSKCESASDFSIFNMEQWTTHSARETIKRAAKIGKSLKPGMVVALKGNLGAGKTTFVKGLALGLGVKSEREVKSPTFVILHIYKGRLPLYHFDLYRLDGPSDLDALGMEDFLGDPQAVSVIEWPERIPEILEQSDLNVELIRNQDETRIIKVSKRKK